MCRTDFPSDRTRSRPEPGSVDCAEVIGVQSVVAAVREAESPQLYNTKRSSACAHTTSLIALTITIAVLISVLITIVLVVLLVLLVLR